MPLDSLIGRYRADAVYRLLAAVFYFTIGWLLALVATAAMLVFLVVDLLYQLVFDADGWSSDGSSWVDRWLLRLYYWNRYLVEYIWFGRRGFPWTPPRVP